MKHCFNHSRCLFSIILLALLGASYHVPAQIINTVAGNGYSAGSGAYGDGGHATAAVLVWPNGIAFDRSGNYYISDLTGHVRKVNTSGIISTFAGTATAGFSGDGGQATAAQLRTATDIATDTAGNVYIADYANYRVRKVNTSGVISTYAGLGSFGYTGDGGPATAAKIKGVKAIVFDATGNLYLTDISDNRVRKVTPAGIISTFAGNGSTGTSGDGGPATAAGFDGVNGIAIDASGNVYVSEVYSSVIRKINTSGIISTIAGTAGTTGYAGDGGPATAAVLGAPYGIEVDAAGNIMFADVGNHCVRRISNTGIITTIAGSTAAGYTGDGGLATAATMIFPCSVALDRYENIFVSDYRNCSVRRIDCSIPDPGRIHGPAYVCVGSSIILTDSTVGGSWVSSDTSIAVVSATGIVAGVYAGSVTIKYGVSSLCGADTATYAIGVAPVATAGVISGPDSLCVGVTTTFASTVSGGSWMSSNTALATIDATTGIAGGVAPGTVTINYVVAGVCGSDTATHSMVISGMPVAGSISGPDSLCVGSTALCAASTIGGAWSCIYPAIATISTTGTVTGLAVGRDTIKYVLTNFCGSDTALHAFRVDAMPKAGTISGVDSVCPGATTALAASIAGGSWWSKNTAIATVSAAGLVTGIATGMDTILYVVSNPCGTDTSYLVLKVRTDASCKAGINYVGVGSPNSVHIIPNPNHGLFIISIPGVQNDVAGLIISNVLGQRVKEMNINPATSTTIVLDVPNGIYFVTLVGSNFRKVERMIIE